MAVRRRTIIDTGLRLACTENDVEGDYDGGRVVLIADSPKMQDTRGGKLEDLTEAPHFLTHLTATLNFRKDEPMNGFPVRREERARKRYGVLIYEYVDSESGEPVDDIPAEGAGE